MDFEFTIRFILYSYESAHSNSGIHLYYYIDDIFLLVNDQSSSRKSCLIIINEKPPFQQYFRSKMYSKR